MNKAIGTISIRGFQYPLITFNIQCEFWTYVRLYQGDTLVYQYIGRDAELVVDLADVSYGQSQLFDDSDLTYVVMDVQKFTMPIVNVEVSNSKAANMRENHQVIQSMTDKSITDKRFYKGDLHAHTNLTDGSLTPGELVAHAKEVGLDFFFITDHNFYHTIWPESELLVLPGVEFTGNTGHWNALNLQDTIDMYSDDYNIESIEGTHRLMDSMRDKGTLVSINHPFLTIWSWLHDELDLTKIDSLELWNDPSYKDNPQATEDALKFWHASLVTGHRITAVGGSDFHHLIDVKDNNRTNALNDPTTHVYCDGLNKDNLLQSIRNGHVFVTRFMDVEAFNVTVNDKAVMFGETMNTSGNLLVSFEVKGEPITAEVTLFTKDKRYVAALENNVATFNIEVEPNDFFRFELRNEALLAFTNPVYQGVIERTTTTYKEVKALMYEV
ncbi:CehA/McbA family metallohydrolase [Macrococcoides goetzii]|uniref:CehA/McbA family metallohydrolase n=1 Tax=Macrococcus TaxID=69965 RepID=UPI001EF23A9D|nr:MULTISPECIES: CehA/McbA family metallohydrolase [Macrococcus]MCG7419609.1 CehA/McbA family metallohydrolase [Macrococcus epidermidis]MCH4984429.1 PHP domain-containing protein [Macrococcus sp. PK]MCH4985170.1 PHP domain-containing protein [Macrococcus sp. PK]